MTDDSADVSRLLEQARRGDDDALRRVTELLYRELKSIAAREMRRENRGHSLQPTALVNEAFMRLLRKPARIQNRHHFLALAATTMRRVLVDYARAKRSQKRGRGVERVTLADDVRVGTQPRPVDILDLDEALDELGSLRPRASQVVELSFFGGHTDREIAEILALSQATVRRDWEFARSWLKSRLRPGGAA